MNAVNVIIQTIGNCLRYGGWIKIIVVVAQNDLSFRCFITSKHLIVMQRYVRFDQQCRSRMMVTAVSAERYGRLEKS